VPVDGRVVRRPTCVAIQSSQRSKSPNSASPAQAFSSSGAGPAWPMDSAAPVGPVDSSSSFGRRPAHSSLTNPPLRSGLLTLPTGPTTAGSRFRDQGGSLLASTSGSVLPSPEVRRCLWGSQTPGTPTSYRPPSPLRRSTEPKTTTTLDTKTLTVEVIGLRGRQGFPDDHRGLVYIHYEAREMPKRYTGVVGCQVRTWAIRHGGHEQAWRVEMVGLLAVRETYWRAGRSYWRRLARSRG